MIIIRGLHNLPDINCQLFITIGNFDGVHLGHKKIIHYMKKKAQEKKAHTMVISFSPHPARVLSQSPHLGLISTLTEKMKILSELGIDFFLILRFTTQFAALRAEEFIEEVLYKRLHSKEIFLGEYHTFGYNNRGSTELLKRIAEKYGFTVNKVGEVFIDGQRVSSSIIRAYLEDGKIHEANKYLGRPYSLTGRVIHGSGRGKKLGYPTANLALKDQLLPASGVYVARIAFNSHIFNGVVNIGTRPTFQENDIIVEIYIFNYTGNLYRKKIKIEILKRLREEITFHAPSDLIQQIKDDISKAQQWMRERN
ncbi:MAG: bifunctional riboflavin kinase/FAD synthetase [bacterium]